MKKKKRLVVLASGEGSNFEAIASAAARGEIAADVVALLCNKAGAPVLDRANRLGVPVHLVDSSAYLKEGQPDRNAYEAALLERLTATRPDLICLAGYMRIIGNEILEKFGDRMLNIHPSLLPKYRGLNAIQQALEAGEKKTGCTVHWVVPAVDAGPIVLQKELPILDDDTEASLRERLRPLEHATYIEALKKLL
ncbi:MAG: phosphoribosylglycinamide formyltransferase [Bdellovibrionales bacterium]|nr:phosphoribosylglycinamide formyltransferase [Bdellovibrionales bacterium]